MPRGRQPSLIRRGARRERHERAAVLLEADRRSRTTGAVMPCREAIEALDASADRWGAAQRLAESPRRARCPRGAAPMTSPVARRACGRVLDGLRARRSCILGHHGPRLCGGRRTPPAEPARGCLPPWQLVGFVPRRRPGRAGVVLTFVSARTGSTTDRRPGQCARSTLPARLVGPDEDVSGLGLELPSRGLPTTAARSSRRGARAASAGDGGERGTASSGRARTPLREAPPGYGAASARQPGIEPMDLFACAVEIGARPRADQRVAQARRRRLAPRRRPRLRPRSYRRRRRRRVRAPLLRASRALQQRAPGHRRGRVPAHQAAEGGRDVAQAAALAQRRAPAGRSTAAPGWWCGRCSGCRRARSSSRCCRGRRSRTAGRRRRRRPARTSAMQASTVSMPRTAAGHHAGVADHVGVGEVDDEQLVVAGGEPLRPRRRGRRRRSSPAPGRRWPRAGARAPAPAARRRTAPRGRR